MIAINKIKMKFHIDTGHATEIYSSPDYCLWFEKNAWGYSKSGNLYIKKHINNMYSFCCRDFWHHIYMIKINKIYNAKSMFGNSLSCIEYIEKYIISIWSDYTSCLSVVVRDFKNAKLSNGPLWVKENLNTYLGKFKNDNNKQN